MINDELIINKQTTYQGTFKGTVSLEAGQKYKIITEYIAGKGSSSCKLEWASMLQSREVLPQSQLYEGASLSGIDDIFGLKGLLNIEYLRTSNYPDYPDIDFPR